MSSKQQVESAAIVLDCRDHGESDLIVTFFCQNHGRLTGIAKGAKRSKKRFVNKLEIFSSLRILHTIPPNNRLAFIAEADLLDGYLALRKNIVCYTTASVIRELILLATKEVEGDEELYPLLVYAYDSLNTNHPPLQILILFLIRFYAIIGYSPQLESCLQCGQEIQTHKSYHFQTGSGGIHCSNCATKGTTPSIALSRGTLKSLAVALNQPLERLHRLQLSTASQQEALSFLHSYGRQLFQREIVSWAFLEKA
ncbi:MAG TPA: DNA repair protein RecO [Desulfocapsa sulfexigens]|nr:DNA repair protein RecO [Desulfocapsa sulfexigens]